MICDECGAAVSTELIDPDGACWIADDRVNCSECRFTDEEL
jgi:hypothetical protein